MTSTDRAAVIAQTILDIFAERMRDDPVYGDELLAERQDSPVGARLRDDLALHYRVATRLRDKFTDMRQELITEIRLAPEPDNTPDSPAPTLASTPRKGGGHENE